MRACRARAIAPAIAASSRPPSRCSNSSGPTPAWRATPSATTAVFSARPASSTPVPRPVQSAAAPPKSAQASAAAEVVLPIPISPVTSRSASGSTASHPVARAATSSASVIAGAAVKSAVGRSSSSAWTSIRAPNVRASWLIAAPPARKFATICTVTSAGKAETPRAVTPWLPAKIRTSGRSTCGRSVPCHPAIQAATSSSRPSDPAGFVSTASRAAAAARAAASGAGSRASRRRKSARLSKGAGMGIPR